jgi:N-methylhydantoinase B/oxoprolinase/acetone carboxylase alpha subunit
MPSTSTELLQEGIIIPCVKLYERGVLTKGILDIVMSNVRTPDEREGDMRAQIAAAQLGQKRIIEVIWCIVNALEMNILRRTSLGLRWCSLASRETL